MSNISKINNISRLISFSKKAHSAISSIQLVSPSQQQKYSETSTKGSKNNTKKYFFFLFYQKKLHHATHTRTRTNCCVIAIHPPYIDHLLATKEEKKGRSRQSTPKKYNKKPSHTDNTVCCIFSRLFRPSLHICAVYCLPIFCYGQFFSHSKRFFYGRGYEGIFCAWMTVEFSLLLDFISHSALKIAYFPLFHGHFLRGQVQHEFLMSYFCHMCDGWYFMNFWGIDDLKVAVQPIIFLKA